MPSFQKVAPQNRRAKVLLLGDAGVGKTHAALTFPKPAVIDAEGSVDWFADRFEFVAIPTKSYSDVRELVRSVRDGKVPCETVIIDSLTTIYNGLVNAATDERRRTASSDDLRPLDWGRIKRKFSSLLDELYNAIPVHVVCVGWIKTEYAKPGDNVNGKIVGPNDMIKIGETFDGDKKTQHAFDFVFKIEGNDGKKTAATVVKSRSGSLKQGQRLPDFSWKTIEGLLPKGEGSYVGMSDEEQSNRDRSVFEGDLAPTAQPAASKASALPQPAAAQPEAQEPPQTTGSEGPPDEAGSLFEQAAAEPKRVRDSIPLKSRFNALTGQLADLLERPRPEVIRDIIAPMARKVQEQHGSRPSGVVGDLIVPAESTEVGQLLATKVEQLIEEKVENEVPL